ncbi:uncharacterized protein LOC119562016 [Drosophila subpulchrella]|uniref:uncharacterized protein LOC119562016 n=1 Tax=Drosophila subpulchrella TaxID=1486046 RepID=UPI0018A130D9|nr:uncharacterized protein LOC119562016 [Drosophila subpulchrella]
MSFRLRLFELIVLLYFIKQISSTVELTNVICTSLDPEFANFEYCYLKSINRTYKYVSLKVNLLKKPITKIKVNSGLLKRFSGYKPYLYNVTVDACRFLKNTKSSPIAAYFYGFFKDHSNMNHTCPFNHDVVVEKLSINAINTHVTEGDYLLQTNWIAYDINRANVKLYFTLS